MEQVDVVGRRQGFDREVPQPGEPQPRCHQRVQSLQERVLDEAVRRPSEGVDPQGAHVLRAGPAGDDDDPSHRRRKGRSVEHFTTGIGQLPDGAERPDRPDVEIEHHRVAGRHAVGRRRRCCDHALELVDGS
jgi:hypothetical protein